MRDVGTERYKEGDVVKWAYHRRPTGEYDNQKYTVKSVDIIDSFESEKQVRHTTQSQCV